MINASSFFLRPSWLLRHLIVVAIVATCSSLGFWQLARRQSRATFNQQLSARLDAPARPFSELKQKYQLEAGVREGDAAAYRRALVEGRYDTEREFLLTPRSRDGQPGFDLITPLVFAENRAILVDRGWVPTTLHTPPVAPAAPAALEVSVEGFLLPEEDPTERGWLRPRNPSEGALAQSFYVDVDRLQGQFPYQLERGYLLLAEQNPAQEDILPALPLAPQPNAGPHLSYALQWFSFAIIGIVGYVLLLRRRWSELVKDTKNS